jgi:hypothetical protein
VLDSLDPPIMVVTTHSHDFHCSALWLCLLLASAPPIIALQGTSIDLNSLFLGDVQELSHTPQSAQFLSPLSLAIHYIARPSVILFAAFVDFSRPSLPFFDILIRPFSSISFSTLYNLLRLSKIISSTWYYLIRPYLAFSFPRFLQFRGSAASTSAFLHQVL